jgi:glycosyltransferase involved in cell wall biosynthesis
MRRFLFVTRNFAPTSHVSAERAIKLAKYLPDFGWLPTVLTGRRANAGLESDAALLDQVREIEVLPSRAPELSLFYARAGKRGRSHGQRGNPRRGKLHPKAWLVPDSQVLWYPFAVHAAMRRARAERWEVVLATTFPPTAILIAHRIASRLRLPYVIDFRDSWTRYHAAPARPVLLAELERRLETRMIADAAAVVAVDGHIVEHALERVSAGRRPPCHVIQNGYDEEDFRGVEAAPLPRFSIVHTGLLRRGPRPLWEGLAQALQGRPEQRGRVHFWQVGYVDPRAMGELEAPPEGVTVHRVPPVPQREAISYMLGADLLLLEELGSIMPSKALQYLRAGRPILALVENGGEIRDVLGRMPQAHLIDRGDPDAVARLAWSLEAMPRRRPETPRSVVLSYSRREIARRFAAVLEEAAERRAGARRLRAPAPRELQLRQ